MMLLPVRSRLHIPQTLQLFVFFDKLECSLLRPFAWHFPFCPCATENYHKLGQILQCAIFNVNNEVSTNHTAQDTALCWTTNITTKLHSLLLLNEIQLCLSIWQHRTCGKNIHISWLYLYRAHSKITQLLTPTHAQLQHHRLKFTKNHLKNSYMFRSTTIFVIHSTSKKY